MLKDSNKKRCRGQVTSCRRRKAGSPRTIAEMPSKKLSPATYIIDLYIQLTLL
ncbi:hypothetical protein Plhal304r1_c009g0034971 [Plasmopara halstedii]